MASTVYRLSLLWDIHTYVPLAEKSRKALSEPSYNFTFGTLGAGADSTTGSGSTTGSDSITPSSDSTTTSDSLSTLAPTTTASNSTLSGPATQTSSASKSTSTAPLPSVTLGTLEHFSTDGWLTPVVDPYQYGQEGTNSPEGEAFVLEMTAAYRDWVAAGSKVANGCMRMSSGWPWAVIVGIGMALHWGL